MGTLCAGSDSAFTKPLPQHERDWQELLIEEDVAGIWHNLAGFVRADGSINNLDSDCVTQELFLHLFATRRFDTYLDKQYSEAAIKADLASILNRRKEQ